MTKRAPLSLPKLERLLLKKQHPFGDVLAEAERQGERIRRFRCPEEGEAIEVGEHLFCMLGRNSGNKLLAAISYGHPSAGDEDARVLTHSDVLDRLAAARWFNEQLTMRPWETRQ